MIRQRKTRAEVVAHIMSQKIVPVFSHPDLRVLKGVLDACYAAGLRTFEVTDRLETIPQLFGELVAYADGREYDVVFGAGSVYTPAEAKAMVDLGASFVVGPITSMEVNTYCISNDIAYSPGCYTPTELIHAVWMQPQGSVQKLFPADGLSPGYVRSVLAPYGHRQKGDHPQWIMPTGGVDTSVESLRAWFKAGIVAAGIGSNLINKDKVDAGDFSGIEADVRRAVAHLEEALKG